MAIQPQFNVSIPFLQPDPLFSNTIIDKINAFVSEKLDQQKDVTSSLSLKFYSIQEIKEKLDQSSLEALDTLVLQEIKSTGVVNDFSDFLELIRSKPSYSKGDVVAHYINTWNIKNQLANLGFPKLPT